MSTIKGVLFDKDGTLVDFHATWGAIADRLAMEAAGGERVLADSLLALAGYDADRGCFRGDSVFAAGTNAEVVALWHPDLTEVEKHAAVARFDRITAESGMVAVAVAGVTEAVAKLSQAGLRLGVATNDSTEGAKRTLLALGLESYFEAAYGYDAVANPKPAPDVVLAFARFTGLSPAEIAMVGDNRHDLHAARAAGAGLAVGVLSGTGLREALVPLADVILTSVADLPAYLAGTGEGASAAAPPAAASCPLP